MRSLQNIRTRVLSVAVSAGLTVAAGSALADSGKADAAKSDVANGSLGIMTFTNVRIVNEQNVQAGSDSQQTDQTLDQASGRKKSAGLRAYIDPATRRLRAETSEDRNRHAEKPQAEKAKDLSTRAANANADVESTDARTMYGPGNTVGVQLTDEHMTYQVAHKIANGLVREEVTGKSAAKKTLQSGKKNLTNAEVSHER